MDNKKKTNNFSIYNMEIFLKVSTQILWPNLDTNIVNGQYCNETKYGM